MAIQRSLLICFLFAACLSQEISHQSASYSWRNVMLGGGGYVTGIIAHPAVDDLIYIRTDVGGCYRWDGTNEKWLPLMDWVTHWNTNLYGIDSLAIDPQNSNIVYIAAGMYAWSPNDILVSNDRGTTWTTTGLNVYSQGNEDYRWAGERLAVDPNNSGILYFASRNNGLYVRKNTTWAAVTSFPVKGTTNYGLLFVTFDTSGGVSNGLTQVIYVGVHGNGVYRSKDGGNSWVLLSNSPLIPQRVAVAKDTTGTIYVTGQKESTNSPRLAKITLNTTSFTNIAPSQSSVSFCGITIRPDNPQSIFVSEREDVFDNKFYISENGGTSWSTYTTYTRNPNVPWWPTSWWSSSTSSVLYDPRKLGRIWYTDWFGTWLTSNISANPAQWVTREVGHEELVVFLVVSTPVVPLLIGVADTDGFYTNDVNNFPKTNFGGAGALSLQDTEGLDYSELNPNFVVRVGENRWNGSGWGGYSEDGGLTFTAFKTGPSTNPLGGRVAVSSDGKNIVWLAQKLFPFTSNDNGQTWKNSTGLPSTATNIITSTWTNLQPLASDHIQSGRFYFFISGVGFYVSNDGGLNWNKTNATLPSGGSWWGIRTSHINAGEIWVHLDSNGLYHSKDAGTSFSKIANINYAHLVGTGKGPQSGTESVYVYGQLNSVDGVWRSDDSGQTWEQMIISGQPIGDAPSYLDGDRTTYNRVYIGTGGRGVYVGESS